MKNEEDCPTTAAAFAAWRCGRCPHPRTITGLRADCMVCHAELVQVWVERDRRVHALEEK